MQVYKASWCVFHARGKCTRGSNCSFAHSAEELRQLPDLRKTKLCNAFLGGQCNSTNCSYAHGLQELRDFPGKKGLCRLYREGKCVHGSSCKYAHALGELEVGYVFAQPPKTEEQQQQQLEQQRQPQLLLQQQALASLAQQRQQLLQQQGPADTSQDMLFMQQLSTGQRDDSQLAPQVCTWKQRLLASQPQQQQMLLQPQQQLLMLLEGTARQTAEQSAEVQKMQLLVESRQNQQQQSQAQQTQEQQPQQQSLQQQMQDLQQCCLAYSTPLPAQQQTFLQGQHQPASDASLAAGQDTILQGLNRPHAQYQTRTQDSTALLLPDSVQQQPLGLQELPGKLCPNSLRFNPANTQAAPLSLRALSTQQKEQQLQLLLQLQQRDDNQTCLSEEWKDSCQPQPQQQMFGAHGNTSDATAQVSRLCEGAQPASAQQTLFVHQQPLRQQQQRRSLLLQTQGSSEQASAAARVGWPLGATPEIDSAASHAATSKQPLYAACLNEMNPWAQGVSRSTASTATGDDGFCFASLAAAAARAADPQGVTAEQSSSMQQQQDQQGQHQLLPQGSTLSRHDQDLLEAVKALSRQPADPQQQQQHEPEQQQKPADARWLSFPGDLTKRDAAPAAAAAPSSSTFSGRSLRDLQSRMAALSVQPSQEEPTRQLQQRGLQQFTQDEQSQLHILHNHNQPSICALREHGQEQQQAKLAPPGLEKQTKSSASVSGSAEGGGSAQQSSAETSTTVCQSAEVQ